LNQKVNFILPKHGNVRKPPSVKMEAFLHIMYLVRHEVHTPVRASIAT